MDFEAIVVGSGFGGAVAALRLGEAGVRTLVLERGNRWPVDAAQNTFAPSTNPDGRFVWLGTSWAGQPVERYTGVREIVESAGMTITQGAGVGGGSLVHAGITYQPARELFRRACGDAIDYDEMDRVYYPRVRSILQASPIPDDVLAASCAEGARRFAEQASNAGFLPRRLDLSVDWDVVRDELAGRKKPSWTIGEFTTNSGAKNTLDRNYLARAEATGMVEIRPLHQVVSIAEVANQGFRVIVEQLDEMGAVLDSQEMYCAHLFLAAGSLGTSTLLLRARWDGTLPRLTEHVGRNWGTNGDRFIPVAPQQRMVTGVAFEHFDNPHGPVLMQDLPDVRFAVTLGGVTGALKYDAGTDNVTVAWRWDHPGNVDATKAVAHTNERFDKRNRLPKSPPCVATRTVHPLGGAVIGRVCDSFGRVFGHRRLYVVDGALLPGTSGCANPSLTIAALAERAMTAILARPA